jgi:hypothetical protein
MTQEEKDMTVKEFNQMVKKLNEHDIPSDYSHHQAYALGMDAVRLLPDDEKTVERIAGFLCQKCLEEEPGCDYPPEERPCDHANIPARQLLALMPAKEMKLISDDSWNAYRLHAPVHGEIDDKEIYIAGAQAQLAACQKGE